MNEQAIAIVGMGCMLPEAGTLAEAWRNIETGKDCIRDIPLTHWRPEDYFAADPQAPDMTYAKRGGFLRPYKFRPLDWGITPNAIEATDTSQILGMVVAHHALTDAGLGPNTPFDKNRVSVIMGVTGTLSLVIPLGARLGHPLWRQALADSGVDAETAHDVIERIKAGYVGWQSASFPGLLGNVVAGRIANRLDLGGTNCVVDAACASSLAAIHLATLELTAGRADAVVTGGVDTFNDIFMYMCFSKTPALSATGDARPFDQNADGTILGEGVGALVLKRVADAQRDGNRIYAVIKAVGTSSDGHGQAIYAPAVKGQTQALQRAYAQAGISPTTIRMVEAHGTGTKVGDEVEVRALTEVFRSAAREGAWCSLGTIKSQVGHTKAAAGVAGLIKAAMAIHKQVLPPSIKVAQPLDGLQNSPFWIEKYARPWIRHPEFPRRAGVSAFGFGGSNFHCVLEEAEESNQASHDQHDLAGILAYSASDNAGLSVSVTSDLTALAQACRTDAGEAVELLRKLGKERRAKFSRQAAQRLILVLEATKLAADGLEQLSRRLAERLARLDVETTWVEGRQAYFDNRANAGKTAVLFPGQGAQYPGMLQALACRSRELRQAVEDADAAYTACHGQALALAHAIFPPSAWTDLEKTTQQRQLMATEKAQPGIGAVSLGAVETLKNLGFRFDATAGHSFGELTALCAAGWLAPTDFHTLSVQRGALMADRASSQGHDQDCGTGGDKGGMLAVAADRLVLTEELHKHGLELVVANHNAPKQTVLAGPHHEIQRAAEVLLQAGFGVKRLDVAAAFHSPLVADTAPRFADVLAAVPLSPQPSVVVYANRSAAPYPLEPTSARQLLVEQIAAPVEFVAMIRRMAADGIRCFVELGPGRRLTGLVRSILDDGSVDCMALDETNDPHAGLSSLAHLVARLAARGAEIDLTSWDADYQPTLEPKKSSLTIAICGANYFEPKRPAIRTAKRQSTMFESNPTPTPSRAGATKDHAETIMPATQDPETASAMAPQPIDPAMLGSPLSRANLPSPACNQPTNFLQQAILSLQRLQEQNAELHRQFLHNQMQTQAMLFNLLNANSMSLQGTALNAINVSPAPPSAPTTPAWMPPPPIPVAATAAFSATSTQPLARAFDTKPAASMPPLVGPTTTQDGPTIAPVPAPMPAVAAPSRAGASAQPTHGTGQPSLHATLLTIVAEKTGYPIEMLTPAMSLEGDLGIDSIKRVEILAELQNRWPQAASVPADELSKLSTLEEIIARLADPRVSTKAPRILQPAAASAADAAGSVADIARLLVEIVADKTGYPTDMIRLEMQLEGDLGIDSIKRVEILSALQERHPPAKSAPAEVLGRCRTLQDIAETAAGGAVEKKKLAAAGNFEPGFDAELCVAQPAINQQTLDIYRVGLDAAPALGVRFLFSADARRDFVIAATDPGTPIVKAFAHRLATEGFSPRIVSVFATPEPAAVQLAGLAIFAPSDESSERPNPDQFLLAAFQTIRNHAGLLRGANSPSRLLSVSFAGGRFAHDGATSADAARDSAISGLLKTAGHEWTDVRTLAIDADPILEVDDLANQLIQLALHETPQEIGLCDGQWLTPTLIPHQVLPSQQSQQSGDFAVFDASGNLSGESPQSQDLAVFDGDARSDSLRRSLQCDGLAVFSGDAGSDLSEVTKQSRGLVVVSGGARGVTAAAVITLAQRKPHNFLLLGRSPIPDSEPAWLSALTEAAAIKQALVTHASEPLKPRELQAAYDAVMQAREMRATFAALVATGAGVIYRSVDARDAQGIAAAVADAVAVYGPVRGLVHGAGVLADRLIEEQTEAQFLSVYETKVRGLEALLAAADLPHLEFIGLFSSTTARLGRKGQGAYAVANEVLNRTAHRLASTYPELKVVSFGWGPWAGGMVSPGLAKVFAAENIALIELAAGAQWFAQSLAGSETGPIEQVIVGAQTVLAPTASVSGQAVTADQSIPQAASEQRPQLFKVMSLDVDIARFPVLLAHVIGGRAVVPAALFMEWMAMAAAHANPGLQITGIQLFRVLKGVILEAHDSRQLQISLSRLQLTEDGYLTTVSITSERADGYQIPHASADFRLSDHRLSSPLPQLPRFAGGSDYQIEQIYAQDLFHGPAMQGIERVLGVHADGVTAIIKSAPAPSSWWESAPRAHWITEPLALDVGFQLMVLWTKATYGSPSLPSGLRSYRQFSQVFPDEGCEARLVVREHGPHKAIGDIEYIADDGRLLARVDGYEATIDAALADAFARRSLGEIRP